MTTPVENIALEIANLGPNEKYVVTIETSDDDANVLCVKRWSKVYEQWLPVQVTFKADETLQ